MVLRALAVCRTCELHWTYATLTLRAYSRYSTITDYNSIYHIGRTGMRGHLFHSMVIVCVYGMMRVVWLSAPRTTLNHIRLGPLDSCIHLHTKIRYNTYCIMILNCCELVCTIWLKWLSSRDVKWRIICLYFYTVGNILFTEYKSIRTETYQFMTVFEWGEVRKNSILSAMVMHTETHMTHFIP